DVPARFWNPHGPLCPRPVVPGAAVGEGVHHGLSQPRDILRKRGQSHPARPGGGCSPGLDARARRVHAARWNSKLRRSALPAHPPAAFLEAMSAMRSIEIPGRIRWADSDAAGRLYFPRIFDYVGEAEAELLRAALEAAVVPGSTDE